MLVKCWKVMFSETILIVLRCQSAKDVTEMRRFCQSLWLMPSLLRKGLKENIGTRENNYDIETQYAYNLSGAYQLVFSLESYLQHKCSTTFSCFQLLTIKIGVSPTSLTLHMYLETDVRFWVSIHWKGNVLMSSATMTSFPKAVASLRRKEHQRKQTNTKIVHSQCSSDNRSDEDFLLAEIAI